MSVQPEPMVLFNVSTKEHVEYANPGAAMAAYGRQNFAPELRLMKLSDYESEYGALARVGLKPSDVVAITAEDQFVQAGIDAREASKAPVQPRHDVFVRDPAPNAVPVPEAKGGTISEEAIERIEKHEEALRAMGFEPTPPVYAKGTRVINYGDNRFAELRSEWETLPKASEAWESLAKNVEREERVDLTAKARDLCMDDDGRLVVPGYGNITVEKRAFANLLSKFRMEVPEDYGIETYGGKAVRGNQVFPSAGPLMARMDPDLRAHVFNEMSCGVDPELTLKLRTRVNKGNRSLFATVSPGYTVVDANEIAKMVGSSRALDDSRAQVTYNPESTNVQVDCIWMPNDRPRNLAAGDFFKAGFRFRTNDSGAGSLKGGGIVYRNLCLNLLIVAQDYAPMVQLRHWGDMAQIETELIGATRKVREGMRAILDDWGVLANEHIRRHELWGQTFDTVEEGLIWAVENEKIGKNISSKVLQENLLNGYKFEQGDTPAALINAMTRAAWEGKFSESERAQLESEAGKLVPLFARAVEA